MIKNLLILLFIGLGLQAVAQESSLLQKYKFRTKRFNALNLLFNSAAQSSNNNNSSITQKSSGVSFSMGADLLSFKSTDKTLQVIKAFVPVQGSFSRFSNASNIEKNNQYDIVPDININQKWFAAKNKFTELGFNIQSQYAGSKEPITNFNTYAKKYKQQNINISTTFGIGKGRLENITDMQNALWLQKKLREDGLLKNKLSVNDANGLAQAITKANNFRMLDGRRRIKYILKTVDNYIAESNLVEKRDIDYFTTLNDVLFFANNFQRLSGTEKYIRFTPGLGRRFYDVFGSNNVANFQNNYILTTSEMKLTLGYQKNKPIDLKHQFNYGLELKGVLLNTTNKSNEYNNGVLTNSFKNKYDEKRLGLNYFLQYSLYPNSRTVINFNVQGDNGVSNAANGTRFYNFNSASISGNYFINYNTSLFFNLGIQNQSNQFNNAMKNNATNLFFNVGLRIGL